MEREEGNPAAGPSRALVEDILRLTVDLSARLGERGVSCVGPLSAGGRGGWDVGALPTTVVTCRTIAFPVMNGRKPDNSSVREIGVRDCRA
mmetsp:Transcript_33888/g.62766  ORF Transcript_33888/g.62766 Transcript_33888/m.62766 type:complete len:91 (+) Transcript_33888:762-1034(+)